MSAIDFPTPEEDQRLLQICSEINRAVPILISYINGVGEPTTIHYSPPPITGGLAGRIDLLQIIFNSALNGIEQHVLDMLDRAIGRYDYLIGNQWKQWINPFYWIGQLIRLPFKLLEFSGFDATKFEFSIFGKIYKLLAGLGTFILGAIKVYEFLKPILASKEITLP